MSKHSFTLSFTGTFTGVFADSDAACSWLHETAEFAGLEVKINDVQDDGKPECEED